MLTVAAAVYVITSLGLGAIEVGLFVQPFLNLGLGYYVARRRDCTFRGMDALKILFATGTVLVATVVIVLLAIFILGPFIGLINAVFSVFYITPKVFKMFPEGGRKKPTSLLDDVKDLVDERQKSLDWGKKDE
jgi:ABC-type sugar transport system permease subunit